MRNTFFSTIGAALAAAVILGATVGGARAANAKKGAARWESDIAKFEAADKKRLPTPGGVLFIGSSSIRMWKTLAEDFPGTPVMNRGFGGSEVSDSLHFADRIVLPYKPRAILIYAGDNDIGHGKSAETVLADFQRFVAKVHAKLPETRIGFIAIKPSLKRWNLAGEMKRANALVEAYCAKDKRLAYHDIWTPMLGKDGKPRPELFLKDGLHMTREGYQVWTKVIRPFVEE